MILNTTTLIFATNNQHKIREIQSLLDSSFKVITLRESGITTDILEPYNTIEKNALEKANVIYKMTKKNCFGEDTGLEVSALNGEPGVKSARYAGEEKLDEKNIEKLLHQLKGVSNRKARFKTVIALMWNEKSHLFEGICDGEILEKPFGTNGFGYDSVFMPNGATCSFAQMTLQAKNIYSHRRKAFDQLITFLKSM